MNQYRRRVSESGQSFARLEGDVWVDMSEDDAKAAGIWRDTRGGQYRVRDPLATSEQLVARDKGHYDPRPASGEHVALRVIVRCAMCGERISEIHEHKRRSLLRHVQSGRWYWSQLRRWRLYECMSCAHGVDVDRVWAGVDRATKQSRTLTVSG